MFPASLPAPLRPFVPTGRTGPLRASRRTTPHPCFSSDLNPEPYKATVGLTAGWGCSVPFLASRARSTHSRMQRRSRHDPINLSSTRLGSGESRRRRPRRRRRATPLGLSLASPLGVLSGRGASSAGRRGWRGRRGPPECFRHRRAHRKR